MQATGADSFAGRLASIVQGSTETTFYVLAVYFGAVAIKRVRHAVAGGLIADLGGFAAAIAATYLNALIAVFAITPALAHWKHWK